MVRGCKPVIGGVGVWWHASGNSQTVIDLRHVAWHSLHSLLKITTIITPQKSMLPHLCFPQAAFFKYPVPWPVHGMGFWGRPGSCMNTWFKPQLLVHRWFFLCASTPSILRCLGSKGWTLHLVVLAFRTVCVQRSMTGRQNSCIPGIHSRMHTAQMRTPFSAAIGHCVFQPLR